MLSSSGDPDAADADDNGGMEKSGNGGGGGSGGIKAYKEPKEKRKTFDPDSEFFRNWHGALQQLQQSTSSAQLKLMRTCNVTSQLRSYPPVRWVLEMS